MVNMYYQDPVQKDLFKVDDKSFNGRRVCEQLPWTVPVIAKEDIKIHKLRFYYGTKNYSCFLLVDYVKIAFSEPDE